MKMRYLVCTLAFAPLLIAATPATPDAPHPPQREVIVERVEAPGTPARHGRVVLDFTIDEESGWTDEHDAILEEAMDELREALAELPGEIEAGMHFDWHDGEHGHFDRERVRVMVERARERAHEAGAMARAEGERARAAAHMARLHGERARVIGLRAGAHGMEAGLRGIEEALESGEVTRNGETRAMTAEERAELLEARAHLQARLAEFREDHAVFLSEDGDGHVETRVVVMRHNEESADAPRWQERDRYDREARSRQVQVTERDGRLEVTIDGERLEGDALTDWLNSSEGQRLMNQRPEPPLAGGE